jgi:tripartite-type tricarboxylate transporter receptor subunit TctC
MMTKQAISLRLGLVLFATIALGGAASAQNAVEELYRGRQINLIIGYGPGGGYDMVGRLLARRLGRYLPGHPTIVAQNMPGAGSLRAVNYLYSVAPRDGTLNLTINSTSCRTISNMNQNTCVAGKVRKTRSGDAGSRSPP